MIYICTVHFETELWIKPQLRYLRANIAGEFRVFACVPGDRKRREFYLETTFNTASTYSYNHADKLNHLARLVGQEARPDDVLIFLDGDAFPIGPLDAFLERNLERYPLMAIQRRENDGDIQPHPSFAATTVGFWNDIHGDWSPGFTWKDGRGNDVTDTGGNLLDKLQCAGVEWLPMHRTNVRNLHPLWFGIYENLIYHHGAGYRKPISRLDLNKARLTPDEYEKTRDFRKNQKLQSRMLGQITRRSNFYGQLMK